MTHKTRRQFLSEAGLIAGGIVAEGLVTSAAPSIPDARKMKWRPTTAPTATSRYDDIWFNDEQSGWAVNSNGQILHTADGGGSWDQQLHDPPVYMRTVAFASPDHGWVGTLTQGKVLFETFDSGTHWKAVNLPTNAPLGICGMWPVDAETIYAAGTNRPELPARMMKTTDGGRNWTCCEMQKWADNVIDVFFMDRERGWVVGGRADERAGLITKPKLRPVILYTEDGGKTWLDQLANSRNSFPVGEWGWKIQFVNERLGFVSLENYDTGAIISTCDAGKTWVRHTINDAQGNANIQGVGFLDENHGWVGGWGDRARKKRTSSETFDGGRTWRNANEIGQSISRFRFFGSPVRVGYASGETIYKYSSIATR